MRTVLISISLLLLSILLVIGCEVIDRNLQDDTQLETEVIQQTSDIEETAPRRVDEDLINFEIDNKERLQKNGDS